MKKNYLKLLTFSLIFFSMPVFMNAHKNDKGDGGDEWGGGHTYGLFQPIEVYKQGNSLFIKNPDSSVSFDVYISNTDGDVVYFNAYPAGCSDFICISINEGTRGNYIVQVVTEEGEMFLTSVNI